ncbi:CHASE3 domain-containing protein [Streptomyces puniciscabiei]
MTEGGRRGRDGRRGLVALTVLAGGLLTVLIGVAFGVLFWSVADMREAALAERHSVAAENQARLVDNLILDVETYQRGFVITRQAQFLRPWTIAQGHFPAQAQELVRISTSPAQHRLAHRIARDGESYIRDYSIPVVAMARRSDPRASSVARTLEGKLRVDALRSLFDRYTTAEGSAVVSREATTDSDAQRASIAAAVGIGASVLLVAAYCGYVTRVIVWPVRRAAHLASRLAEGDLTARVPRTGAREIGQLETAFNTMAGSLERSLEQAREAHRRLRLLCDATTAVGTTLDVTQTARERDGRCRWRRRLSRPAPRHRRRLPFETTELELAPGSTLALYSDGLVRSRELDLDRGPDRLRHVLASSAQSADSLDAACGAVMDALLTAPPSDDVALLLARTRALSSDQVVTWDIPAEPEYVAHARSLTTERLEAWRLEESSFVTELVVSELVTTAIRYGRPPIQLRLIRDTTLICEVSDGSSTAPHMRRARVFDEGGRGLLLVAQLSRRWGTRHGPAGKTIWCEQALPATGRGQ